MTRVIHIHDQNDLTDASLTASAVLQAGGVVLYPTDTTYALGVNALDPGAVNRVFQLKGRDYGKPIHVIVRDIEQASRYVTIFPTARRIADQFLPGALTLVLGLNDDSKIPPLLVAGAGTLGIRIPHHPVCMALSEAVDFPITTTSANRSGLPNAYQVDTIRQQLGSDFDLIDLVLDVGELTSDGVSTVIAMEDDDVKLIREGAVPFARIANSLAHLRRKA